MTVQARRTACSCLYRGPKFQANIQNSLHPHPIYILLGLGDSRLVLEQLGTSNFIVPYADKVPIIEELLRFLEANRLLREEENKGLRERMRIYTIMKISQDLETQEVLRGLFECKLMDDIQDLLAEVSRKTPWTACIMPDFTRRNVLDVSNYGFSITWTRENVSFRIKGSQWSDGSIGYREYGLKWEEAQPSYWKFYDRYRSCPLGVWRAGTIKDLDLHGVIPILECAEPRRTIKSKYIRTARKTFKDLSEKWRTTC